MNISDLSTRTLHYSDINISCPRYNCDTESGKTFLVTAIKLWNSLPINTRSSTSVNAFKQNYVNFIKEGYAGLNGFPVSQFFVLSDPFLILH